MDIPNVAYREGQEDGNRAIRGRPLDARHPPKPAHIAAMAQQSAASALASYFMIALLEKRAWTWSEAEQDVYLTSYCDGFVTTYMPSFVNPSNGAWLADLLHSLKRLIFRTHEPRMFDEEDDSEVDDDVDEDIEQMDTLILPRQIA